LNTRERSEANPLLLHTLHYSETNLSGSPTGFRHGVVDLSIAAAGSGCMTALREMRNNFLMIA
jgi:hypothetical protein